MHVREGEHYDHQHPPFEMPGDGEQVALPSGQRLGGAFGRVFWLLFESCRRGLRYHLGGNTYGKPGEVPTWALRHMWAGGTSGDRRARQMHQEMGLPISSRMVSTGGGRGSAVGVYLYSGVLDGVSIRPRAIRRQPREARRTTPPRLVSPRRERSPEPIVAPATPREEQPLSGVRLRVLWPTDESPGVQLFETALSPSGGLIAQVARSALLPWDADARYREELVRRREELVAAIRELDGEAIVCPRIGTWTPATVLRAFVDHLGARAA